MRTLSFLKNHIQLIFYSRTKWLVLDVKVAVFASSATNAGPCSARTSRVSTTTPKPPAAVVPVENPGDRNRFKSWSVAQVVKNN